MERLLWAQSGGKISLWKLNPDGHQLCYKEHGPFEGWIPVNCSGNKVLWYNQGAKRISLWIMDDEGNQVSYKEHGPFEGWTPVYRLATATPTGPLPPSSGPTPFQPFVVPPSEGPSIRVQVDIAF